MLKTIRLFNMLAFKKNKNNNKVVRFYINNINNKKLTNKLKKIVKIRKNA